MAEDQELWQQRLAKRRAGVPWNTIAKEEGVHPNTFRDWRNKARQAGWIPAEEELPPAIRRDGKRVGAPRTPQVTLTAQEDARPNDPVSTIVDIGPVNAELLSLSPDEAQTLAHYEHIIAQGIQTFVEVGHALLTIRDRKLYRQASPTFEAYCRERWDLSRPRAYQLIDAAQVVETVSTVVDIVPMNEAQARPLATLPAEQQQEVWREAVETAPPSGITARHVQQTVKRAQVKPLRTGTPKSPAEETGEWMGERSQPNRSWLHGLSQAHRLCSSLRRLPDLDEVLESWGAVGRQQAVASLRPLSEDAQQLLWALKAIDAKAYDGEPLPEKGGEPSP